MKTKAIMVLCAVSLLMMIGCSKKAELPNVTVEKINVSDQNTDLEAEGTSEGLENQKTNTEIASNIEEFEGTVKSIGDDFVVVSKVFTEKTEDSWIAVSPAEGSNDEVLITVRFTENTKYELHTVKNGGVNGDADVTKTEASYADIKERINVKFTGTFITPDKEFIADGMIIYNFI